MSKPSSRSAKKIGIDPVTSHKAITVGAIDSNGVISAVEYYPFGRVSCGASTLLTDKAFTGQQQEPNSTIGAYFYKARFYSTNLSHFVAPDLVTIDGLDRYTYTRNSPIGHNDPTGGLTDGDWDARHTREECDAWRAAAKAYQDAAASIEWTSKSRRRANYARHGSRRRKHMPGRRSSLWAPARPLPLGRAGRVGDPLRSSACQSLAVRSPPLSSRPLR